MLKGMERINIMQIIDTLTGILYYVIYGLVVLILLVGIVAFIIYHRRNQRRRIKEDETDYSTLERKDAISFIKIDDIKNDMIIADHGNRFIGVIQCEGFDFYSAQSDEQLATGVNFLSFIDTLTKPVTYREYSKVVDIEDTVENYKEAYKNVEKELYNAVEDQKALTNAMRKRQDMSLEEIEKYDKEMEKAEKKIKSLIFREKHITDQLEYADKYSGSKMIPDVEQTWVYDWKYNSMEYPVDLTEEQILKKAAQELNAKARAMSHALSSVHVKAKRCKTEELIDMCRRYSSPISTTRFKLKDLLNTSYYDDIITSDALSELREKTEKMGQEDMKDNMTELMTEIIEKGQKGVSTNEQKKKK